MDTEKIVYINSAIDRQTIDIDTASWTTYLALPIKVSHINHIKLQIMNLEIPNTAYTFPLNASSFWWIHGVGTTNTLRLLNLSLTRIFSATDLVIALNSAMTTAGYNLAFSYSATTCSLTVTNNEVVPIRIVGSYRYSDNVAGAVSNNVADRFGFTDNMIGTQINATASLTAPAVLRLLRSNCYYITCDAINGVGRQSYVPSPYAKQSNILGRCTSNNFGFLSQPNFSSPIQFTTSDTIIDSLSFSILDDELNPISLNQCPVTFALKVIIS